MNRRPSRPAFAVLALLLLPVLAKPAPAFTRLEGEYYLQVDMRKQDRRYEWDFDSDGAYDDLVIMGGTA